MSEEKEEGSDRVFMKELWNDTYLQWELLVDKKGYKPENIIVLYRLGKDYWQELIDAGETALHERYTPQHLGFSSNFQITNFPATRKSLEEVKRILRDEKQINENDFLYVWTFGHGGSDGVETSYLCMLKDTYWIDPITGEIHQGEWEQDNVYDYDFAEYFVDLPAVKKVYSMAQCYAGGFKDDLTLGETAMNVFFDCAADVLHPAKVADNYAKGVLSVPYMEKEFFSSQTFLHSEYNFHKYGSLAGENPQFQDYYHLGEGSVPAVYFNEADGMDDDPALSHIDGVISVEEARIWNITQNTQISATHSELENPDHSDPANIGYHTSLEYPSLLFNECSDPASYLFSDPDGISGIVGISQTLVLDPALQLKFNNSETTLLDDKVIQIPSGASLSVSNSYLKGFGFDKEAVKGDDSDYLLGNGISLRGGDLMLSSSSLTGIGFPRAQGAQISVGEEVVFNNIYLELLLNSVLKSDSYGKISLDQNTNIIVYNGTVDNLTLSNNGNIILRNNSVIQNSIAYNNSGSSVTIGAASTVSITSNSFITFEEGSLLELSDNSVLIIESGAGLVIQEGAQLSLAEGAQIIIRDESSLTANGTIFTYTGETGKWTGIDCEVGSSITLVGVNITDAVTAVSGSPLNCTISNSVLEGCTNGISLVNCDSYIITSNRLTGYDTGTGVSLAVSNGTFWNNTVENFNYGVRFTSCSPQISNNVISNNKKFGIYVFGYNSNPQLLLSSKAQGLNNSIINNGTNPPSTSPFVFSDAQIGIMPYGNVYLKGGMNNIHSGQTGTVPTIPCISVSPYTIVSDPPIIIIEPTVNPIEAAENYWGASDVNYTFFDLRWSTYSINYNPWYTEPLTGETVQPSLSSQESPDTETTILSNAMLLEEKENYTASIKQYEHVIDKYEDTPEYYVALARLPYVYLKAGIETESLISTYDTGLGSDDITQKKFLKEMKIATHIKGKRYETAKALAVEMKAEALTEDEISISEIDIAICDMMMESGSKGEKSTIDYMARLNNLLLKDDDQKTEPTVIGEELLPKEIVLYQNYP
ncbi:MAG: right-handed parallel beta-helix repeat-containing protein, partial [Endomicrobiaceae bacterium]|nr:right-handed parallel beta-helix repeat-containing protein [Endomicrobiaceae bacterium]